MINPVAEEFRRHAAECCQMARETRDMDSKTTWIGLAERWIHCAELAEAQTEPPRRVTNYRHVSSHQRHRTPVAADPAHGGSRHPRHGSDRADSVLGADGLCGHGRPRGRDATDARIPACALYVAWFKIKPQQSEAAEEPVGEPALAA